MAGLHWRWHGCAGAEGGALAHGGGCGGRHLYTFVPLVFADGAGVAARRETPLHHYSIYNSKDTGAKLISKLSRGARKPATAAEAYIVLLPKWLDEYILGKAVG